MQFFNYDEITVWRQSGDYTVYNTESHTGLTAEVDWDRGLLVVKWQQGTDCWLLGESCTRWEGRDLGRTQAAIKNIVDTPRAA
jgi:hypothetical protein